MKRYLVIIAVLVGVLVSMLFVDDIVRGQSDGTDVVLQTESQAENTREVSGSPSILDGINQPNIGFIDSPSATCYQPDPSKDECFINWYYLNVDATPNYMISMTVAINSIGTLANIQGFFQTSIYVPYNMLGDGFKVACGSKGASGNPLLGNGYAYTIRARDTAGLSSANYGTTYCPYYTP